MIFIPRQNLVLDMLASLVPTREPLRIVLQIKGREVCLEKGTKCFGGIDLNEREVCPAIPPSKKADIWGVPARAAKISALDLPVAFRRAVDETRRKLYPSW